MIHYDNRKFRPVNNTANGETNEETIFHYRQEGNVVSAQYSGGKIVKGHLLGLVAQNGDLHFSYHQVNEMGALMTGSCISTPEILAGGKLRLHEKWKWTSGDFSEGTSVIEEV